MGGNSVDVELVRDWPAGKPPQFRVQIEQAGKPLWDSSPWHTEALREHLEFASDSVDPAAAIESVLTTFKRLDIWHWLMDLPQQLRGHVMARAWRKAPKGSDPSHDPGPP